MGVFSWECKVKSSFEGEQNGTQTEEGNIMEVRQCMSTVYILSCYSIKLKYNKTGDQS